jgi:hypothetical protein
MDEEPREQASCLRLSPGRALLAALVAAFLAGCYSLGGGARMPPDQRHEAGGTFLQTKRGFLVGTDVEAPGYGLYSYLLFEAPPASPGAEELYAQAVIAYLEYLSPIAEREAQDPGQRRRLNVAYLPVTETPPSRIGDPKLTDRGKTAAASRWILDHYNYTRAHNLLGNVRWTGGDGPVLISSLQPLSATPGAQGPRLQQDLTGFPPAFIRGWVQEFFHLAAAPEDWHKTSLRHFSLMVRTTAARSAELLPSVRDSVQYWIRFLEGPSTGPA